MKSSHVLAWTIAASLALAATLPAGAADPVKIGFVTTLSGPGGYTGEDIRDGFQLAIDEEGGKLGGVPVQVIVADDHLQPAAGKAAVDKLLEQDKVKLITGMVFSNVMVATVPTIMDAGAFYISPNAGPAPFAGKGCNKNLFVASFQNDAASEPAGLYSNQRGYKKMIVLAPNYQAGKDMINGFKSAYKGQIADEIYVNLNQTDFSAEIARIRDEKPDALFYFLPGGLGIAFLKQWAAAGLQKEIPIVVTVFSADGRIVSAVGDSALGVTLTGHWNSDFPNAANKKFVAGFESTFHRLPTFYAAEGYDTAKLIASGLRSVGGDLTKADAFRAELEKAQFASVRGAFKFGKNHFPIEDWYSMRVVAGPDGKPTIRTLGKVVSQLSDPFVAQCKM